MCGIAVIMNNPSRQSNQNQTKNRLAAMLRIMEHRGPDGKGMYADEKIGFGMTRLAIVGGEDGSQPIWNEEHSMAIVCNGEIYNHQILREALEKKGHVFSTRSDIEVILHLYETYGEECLNELEGIFAFVIWDTTNQTLLAARDRAGVKPLYYSDTGSEVIFCSELQALIQDLPENPKLNKKELGHFHTFRFVPGDQTLVNGIQKLKPANYMVVKQGNCSIRSYWSPKYPNSKRKRRHTQQQGRTEQLRRKLLNAVESQAAPGVKSGIFLSGGLDSTAILAMHHELFNEVPDTFTVGFSQPRESLVTHEYSELEIANKVAGHYGSRHFTDRISPDEVLEHLPSIISALDEPIADPTAIPLWFVSRLAHQKGMKVVFSGEGLDELFGGYAVYESARFLDHLQWVPQELRQPLHSVLSALKIPGGGVIQRSMTPVYEWYQGVGGVFSPEECQKIVHKDYVSSIKESHLRKFVKEITKPVWDKSAFTQMTHFDLLTWLPENTLVKSDKISMSHSLELRVPFLDNGVIDFSLKTHERDKIRGKESKSIVRRALANQIPEFVFNRKKIGFPVPISSWIFEEWRDYVLSTLLSPHSFARNIYRTESIEQLMKPSPKSRDRSSRLLWTLLSLELWFQNVYSRSELKAASIH